MMPATLHNQLMYKQIIYSFLLSLLIVSCGGDNSSSPDVENSSNSHSSEIPCDATNEGTIIKPTDSDVEHICKGGSWIAIGSSSSSNNIITNETKQSSSSSSYNVILSASEESSSSVDPVILSSDSDELSSSSSSSVIASETKQSSSSGYDNDDSSSSSEEPVESSSSEESKLYLCEDGETYVLDPANCEKESSSSVAVASSSSDNKPVSSSSVVQESSSSEMSSSSEKIDSSSSKVESSSDISISSSSNPESSSEESSSSLSDGYDAINNTLTDPRDGHIYKTVTIGTQVWMAQNLNYLPEDTIGTIWSGLSLCGGGTWKSKMEGDCSIFGRLYETDFTNEKKDSICPNGWSLPTGNQFQKLMSYLGENSANKMKINNDKYWQSGNATNESGFSAIPSGVYSRAKGFNNLFSENEEVAAFAHVQYLGGANGIEIVDSDGIISNQSFGNGIFLAVRCIRN